MTKIDILAIAWKNLMRRKGRTALTVLGVIIGVTAIIVMVSLGLGLSKSQMDMIEQWGSLNEIDVSRGWANDKGEGTLKLNDDLVENLKLMEGVENVIPLTQTSLQLKWGKLEGNIQVYGVEPEYMDMLGFSIGEGRILQEGDRVAIVMGGTIGDNFYDPTDDKYWDNYEYDPDKIYEKTLGMLNANLDGVITNYDTNKEKKIKVEVVGVLDKDNKGAGWNAYMPISFVRDCQKFTMSAEDKKEQKKEGKTYDSIKIITTDMSYSKSIAQDLNDQGYSANTIASELEGLESQSKIIQAVLGGIGSITLLVAAIGIINTMIMSIYERTKEIAIMKVIGASFGDIRLLFLTEAALIGLIGGVIGLGLSFGLSHLINQMGAAYMGDYITTLSLIPAWLVIFAIFFSMMIGILAGIYPANKAVKLSPIEAMRNN